MNTANGSIHPGIKAIVATCSLGLMSLFVWYSQSQAQSKPTPSEATTAKSPAPPSAAQIRDTAKQEVTQVQRGLLLSGTKSFAGTTTLNAGTLTPPSAPNPPSEKQSTVLMPGSKVGILTTTTTTPAPPTNPQPPTDQQRSILMMSSKSGTLTTTTAPGASVQPANDQQKKLLMSGSKSTILTTTMNPGATTSPAKGSDTKVKNKQPQPEVQSKGTQPTQAAGKSPQPDKPKDVLMFSTKAISQPVFSTRKTEIPNTQKAAPPVQQQNPEQK